MIATRKITKTTAAANALRAKLRHHITARNLQPGEFVAAERDLARSERVNRMVARQAVDALVREGLLERRSGKGVYVRSPQSATRLVQIVVPDGASQLHIGIAQGAKEAGLRVGVRTLIHDAHGSFDSDLEMVRQLPQSAAHGAIVVSVHHSGLAGILYELKATRYPFVLVDEMLQDTEVPSVVADNYRGGYLVGQELIRRGHQRIGFVGYLGCDTVRDRLEGLRDALANANPPLPSPVVGRMRVHEFVGDRAFEVDRATREALVRPNRPTAIFFHHDGIAADGCRTIRALGLRIPGDISVVGFDGLPLGRYLTPTLATVRQPTREMGAAAMEMLLALMDGDAMAGESKIEAGVVSRAAPTPVAVRDGSKVNGHGEAATWGHSEGGGMKAEGGRNGQEVSVAGRGVAPMETEVSKFSRPRRPAANTTRGRDGVWHRVLPVTWQDGESLGPAPGAAGDFTTKDTKNTKATVSCGIVSTASQSRYGDL